MAETIADFAKSIVEAVTYLGMAGLAFFFGGNLIVWIMSLF